MSELDGMGLGRGGRGDQEERRTKAAVGPSLSSEV